MNISSKSINFFFKHFQCFEVALGFFQLIRKLQKGINSLTPKYFSEAWWSAGCILGLKTDRCEYRRKWRSCGTGQILADRYLSTLFGKKLLPHLFLCSSLRLLFFQVFSKNWSDGGNTFLFWGGLSLVSNIFCKDETPCFPQKRLCPECYILVFHQTSWLAHPSFLILFVAGNTNASYFSTKERITNRQRCCCFSFENKDRDIFSSFLLLCDLKKTNSSFSFTWELLNEKNNSSFLDMWVVSFDKQQN